MRYLLNYLEINHKNEIMFDFCFFFINANIFDFFLNILIIFIIFFKRYNIIFCNNYGVLPIFQKYEYF